MNKTTLLIVFAMLAVFLVGCTSTPDNTKVTTQPIKAQQDSITGDAVSPNDLVQQVDAGFEDENSELEIGEMI